MAHVLTVDDSATIRHLVRMVLEPGGFEVREAGNGAEGLELLRAAREPMVVLVDYHMPVMDGEAMLRAVAQEGTPLTSHEYVIFSAHTGTFPDSMIELLRSLSIRVLAKPAENTQLIEAVTQAAARLAMPPDEPVPWDTQVRASTADQATPTPPAPTDA